RELHQLRRVCPGRRVPHVEAEPHAYDAKPMAVTELAPSEKIQELRARYGAFMDEHVYPNERALRADDAELIRSLRAKAKAERHWAPHVPPEAGGTGQGFLPYAHLNEEIGRSTYAQLGCGGQAPDAGNGEILHLFGTD